MAQYEKKLLTIQAVQLTGFDGATPQFDEPMPSWLADAMELSPTVTNAVQIYWKHGAPILAIATPEGFLQAQPGDWIIRGIRGEIYPCKPEIFDETYQAVG